MTQHDTIATLLDITTRSPLLKELCEVINNRPKNRSEFWTLLEHMESQEWEQIQQMKKDHSPDGALLPSYLHNKMLFRSTRDNNLMVELVTYTHMHNQHTHDMTQAVAVFDLAQKEMLVATDLPSDSKVDTMPITEAALKRLFRDHNLDKPQEESMDTHKIVLHPASAN